MPTWIGSIYYSVGCSNMIHLEGVGCFKSETKLDLRTSFYLVEEFGGLWSLFKVGHRYQAAAFT